MSKSLLLACLMVIGCGGGTSKTPASDMASTEPSDASTSVDLSDGSVTVAQDLSSVDGATDDLSQTTGGTTLLAQPTNATGIVFFNAGTLASGMPPSDSVWRMVNWVYAADEKAMVKTTAGTTWNAGLVTGFTPTSPTTAQYAYDANATGPTTTAQMEGDTVGAYVNSADLINQTAAEKMSLWPEVDWTIGKEPVPFSSDGSSLTVTYELTVPTAKCSDDVGFIHTSLLFVDSVSGKGLSMTAKVFSQAAGNLGEIGVTQDTDSKNYEMNVSVGAAYASTMSPYITTLDGTSAQTDIFTGYKPIAYSISKTQFAAVIAYITSNVSGTGLSADPANYKLTRFHQNAEFNVTPPQTCELGWSMRKYVLQSN